MKVKIHMILSKFIKYKEKVEKYNKSLPIGVIPYFINRKILYKCSKCRFTSKHKYDSLKHYRRIHINGGKSKYYI